MLEKLDLKRRLKKAEFKAQAEDLEARLSRLQREARSLGLPIIVVFEGWGGAGKGTQINNLILPLDPRGFTVFTTPAPTAEEARRPFLWRPWCNTPAKGRMAIFDRGWYPPVLDVRSTGDGQEAQLAEAFDDIEAFERQLAAAGTLIIKFFLHISQSEQKRRFAKLEKNPSTRWRVSDTDLGQNRHYQKHLAAVEEMLARTDREFARWTLVEAQDERFAAVKIFATMAAAIEERVAGERQRLAAAAVADPGGEDGPRAAGDTGILAALDLSLSLGEKEYRRRLKAGQRRLRELEHEIYMRRLPAIIVYEGCDAAGKGGNIKRLTKELDPRGYEVIPVAAPNDIEKAHHYLWRFWMALPKTGHLAIFDRSWYGRVLVERVEGFCSRNEWQRAFAEINEFERHLANFGAIIVKFWLQIDPDEQLRRFEERQRDPDKQWKITDEDWRNREKWEQYEAAVEEMLFRTSTVKAPWTVIESNCKRHARVKCLETTIAAIEAKL